MHKTMPLVAALAVIALGLSAGEAPAGDIHIGVNIAVPAPPVVLAPPPLVIVPGTLVHQVPSASFNLFVYRSRYYSFHNDAWFVAAVDDGYPRGGPAGGPWSAREALQDPARASQEAGSSRRRLVPARPGEERPLLRFLRHCNRVEVTEK